LDLVGGELALSAVAVAFGGAHRGVGGPAHQFAELGLGPPVALAQDADVRADDGELFCPGLIGMATSARHHAPACQMT